MKSAKERKMERKRKNKELSATKTVKSRQRRLDNKAKRAEIISINSHAKIDIIDQETYVDGVRVEIIDSKIVPILLEPEIIIAADEGETNVMVEAEKGKAIDAQVEKERLGTFNPFRWKK